MDGMTYNRPNRNVVNFENYENMDKKLVVKTKISDYKHNEGGEFMDDLLSKYIEKVDRDHSDLRRDINESEKRTQKSVDDSEHRMDKRLDRIEQLIQDQNNKIEQIITIQNGKIDSLSDNVTEKLNEDRKYRHTNNIAIVIGVITVVIAIATMCFGTLSTITNLLK